MLKMEKDYEEKYGDITEDYEERINQLLTPIKTDSRRKLLQEEIFRIRNVEWITKKFTIYLLPKATPRPRLGQRGVFYVKGAKDNKKLFKKFINDIDIDIITTPTKFTCKSYFPIPSSMNQIEKILAEIGLIRPISKPDWDNVGKAYCDMLQGLILYDDSLIVEGVSKKYYSMKPRIEITISYMKEHDSGYNRKKMKEKG